MDKDLGVTLRDLEQYYSIDDLADFNEAMGFGAEVQRRINQATQG